MGLFESFNTLYSEKNVGGFLVTNKEENVAELARMPVVQINELAVTSLMWDDIVAVYYEKMGDIISFLRMELENITKDILSMMIGMRF